MLAQVEGTNSPYLIKYDVAGPTLARFHASDKIVRTIIGPVRSGSSVACCAEMMRRSLEQKVGPDGLRRSRWMVVRNTYPELKRTTIKTFMDWYGNEQFGRLNKNDMTFYLKFNDIEAEIIFLAMDVPDDRKKLLSFEYTGAWGNEARELPKDVIDMMIDRSGQYPGKMFGGISWRGIFLDTNPPDSRHWLSKFSQNPPRGWDFFHQPGGLIETVDGEFIPNPDAENIHNLNEGINYYLDRVPGKKKDYVRVYYCAQFGYVKEGRPVHEEYVDSTHCATKELNPVPGLPLTIGIDFGLTPAAVIGQKQVNGQWLILRDITTERMGISQFCDILKPFLLSEFKGFEFNIYADPHGVEAAQTDEQTPFDIMLAKGIPAEPAYHNNDPTIRREALYRPLTRMIDGRPGLVVDPRCDMLRDALKGGYCYKRMRVSGNEDTFSEKPSKNKFSHVAEALEYLLLGAGEGDEVLRIHDDSDPEENQFHRHETPLNSEQAWML